MHAYKIRKKQEWEKMRKAQCVGCDVISQKQEVAVGCYTF